MIRARHREVANHFIGELEGVPEGQLRESCDLSQGPWVSSPLHGKLWPQVPVLKFVGLTSLSQAGFGKGGSMKLLPESNNNSETKSSLATTVLRVQGQEHWAEKKKNQEKKKKKRKRKKREKKFKSTWRGDQFLGWREGFEGNMVRGDCRRFDKLWKRATGSDATLVCAGDGNRESI